MPPASQPVAFSGALQLAADQSLPPDAIPFNVALQCTQVQSSVLNLSGSGTEDVPFGTITNAKGLLIRYDANQQGASALTLTINAGSEPVELTPGGAYIVFNPAPGAGITTCSIAFLTSCQVRAWVLG